MNFRGIFKTHLFPIEKRQMHPESLMMSHAIKSQSSQKEPSSLQCSWLRLCVLRRQEEGKSIFWSSLWTQREKTIKRKSRLIYSRIKQIPSPNTGERLCPFLDQLTTAHFRKVACLPIKAPYLLELAEDLRDLLILIAMAFTYGGYQSFH